MIILNQYPVRQKYERNIETGTIEQKKYSTLRKIFSDDKVRQKLEVDEPIGSAINSLRPANAIKQGDVDLPLAKESAKLIEAIFSNAESTLKFLTYAYLFMDQKNQNLKLIDPRELLTRASAILFDHLQKVNKNIIPLAGAVIHNKSFILNGEIPKKCSYIDQRKIKASKIPCNIKDENDAKLHKSTKNIPLHYSQGAIQGETQFQVSKYIDIHDTENDNNTSRFFVFTFNNKGKLCHVTNSNYIDHDYKIPVKNKNNSRLNVLFSSEKEESISAVRSIEPLIGNQLLCTFLDPLTNKSFIVQLIKNKDNKDSKFAWFFGFESHIQTEQSVIGVPYAQMLVNQHLNNFNDGEARGPILEFQSRIIQSKQEEKQKFLDKYTSGVQKKLLPPKKDNAMQK